jgi:MSHA biogenesis protein MshJ
MKEQWLLIQQKIDGLNQRERVLVLATTVVLIFMVIQTLLIDPVLKDREAAQRQIKEIFNELRQKKSETELIQAELTVGVNRNKVKQRKQLQAELNQLDSKIQQSVVAMIPPRLMPQVLEALLVESKGLKLLSLENKAVVPVITQLAAANGEQGEVQQSLYNHGFVLQLSGDYLSSIRYFEKLAALPWRFYWDKLRYKVDSYPAGIITLEVHTVSMAEEWIGV